MTFTVGESCDVMWRNATKFRLKRPTGRKWQTFSVLYTVRYGLQDTANWLKMEPRNYKQCWNNRNKWWNIFSPVGTGIFIRFVLHIILFSFVGCAETKTTVTVVQNGKASSLFRSWWTRSFVSFSPSWLPYRSLSTDWSRRHQREARVHHYLGWAFSSSQPTLIVDDELIVALSRLWHMYLRTCRVKRRITVPTR